MSDFANRLRADSSSSDTSFQVFDSVASTQVVKPQRRPAAAKKAAAAKSALAASQGVEGAVFSHIQAMRALGNMTVTTDQIARALSLPRSAVDAAVSNMRGRGVKIAR